MTEVKKTGANNKVASMFYVIQLETRTVSHIYFSNNFTYSFTPSNLKIGLEVSKASGKLN